MPRQCIVIITIQCTRNTIAVANNMIHFQINHTSKNYYYYYYYYYNLDKNMV